MLNHLTISGLFVTGTDTGVGKSIVAQGLCRWARRLGMNAVGIKPIETGCAVVNGELFPEDGALLQAASEGVADLALCAPFRYALPASPERAAKAEGKRIVPAEVEDHIARIAIRFRPIICEGAGGLMVPISQGYLMIDLILSTGFPVVLVAGTKLGTINHTLLSVEALRNRNIPICSIVLSQTQAVAGLEEKYTPVDIATRLPDIHVSFLPRLETGSLSLPDVAADQLSKLLPESTLYRSSQ